MPSTDRIMGVAAGAAPIEPVQAIPAAMEFDEMGNEVEAFEVWYCHSVCLSAGMFPSISAAPTKEQAEGTAVARRKDASIWACAHVTGPHTHYRPKKGAIVNGPRVGTAADLGCEVL